MRNGGTGRTVRWRHRSVWKKWAELVGTAWKKNTEPGIGRYGMRNVDTRRMSGTGGIPACHGMAGYRPVHTA